MQWIWLAAIVGFIIVEASTLSLVSVWFIPGAIAALILALCKAGIGWQIAVFIILSVGSLTFMRPVFKKMLRVKNVATNADSLIGEKCIVTEPVDNIKAIGAVRIRGQIWTARSTSDSITFAVGDVVTVASIAGVKLICNK